MDPRLLKYYNQELQHLREVGAEFAKEYPKIAGRLGLDGFECVDPYVERLLEGFAFLAARVQLKVDAEFPHFTQHLLEIIYPQYLAPTPSMTVVQLQPDLTSGALASGFPVPRGSALRSVLGRDEQTPCEYRTAHDTTLWPLELTEGTYLRDTGEIAGGHRSDVKAGLRLRLRATAGTNIDTLALERLPLYLQGTDEIPMRLYEQLLGHAVGVVLRPAQQSAPWQLELDATHIRRCGFADEEALLPHGSRSFHGFRLLHEYFAFPARYMFVELDGLGPAVQRCTHPELEIIFLFDQRDDALEDAVESANFALFCTPAINVFPKRADRIHLTHHEPEYHLVVDRTRPMDFEIYEVLGAVGHGTAAEEEREFQPFYSSDQLTCHAEEMAYYMVHRRPRQLSARQQRRGARSSYIGNEVFLSLVDARQAPLDSSLRQLSAQVLCTNRDLPLHMPVGQGKTDFTLESGAPVEAIRCLAGPTRPSPTRAEGEAIWRLISHLSLNYLTLLDDDERKGGAALRDLLTLYASPQDSAVRKQIEGLKSVASAPITRRATTRGPIAYGRGLEVTLTFDENAFEGTGVFLLGAVLDEFFDKYVAINSFTETVVRTLERGEIIRWPMRSGRRHLL